jgi:nucleoside-diphosphate-sugar epimerase
MRCVSTGSGSDSCARLREAESRTIAAEDRTMIAGITGGTGLIGNALALRLQKRGDSVRVLALPIGDDFPRIPGVEYVFADMAVSAEPLPGFVGGLDVLYHCAGEVRDEGRMHAAHVTAVKNLCGAAAHRVGHWVQLSSVGIYGPQPCGVVTEETPWNPLNTYERTKAESERIVRGAAGPGAFSFSVLRPSNIFGPRMANRSLFQMIEMIDRRLFFYIGRPGASANYIPVESVVESLVLCGTMPAARNRTYNVSDHLSLEDFVGAISRHLGKTPGPGAGADPGSVAALSVDAIAGRRLDGPIGIFDREDPARIGIRPPPGDGRRIGTAGRGLETAVPEGAALS